MDPTPRFDADDSTFPGLSPAELAAVRPLAVAAAYADGATIFHAGQAALDLLVVESGGLEIRNPADGGKAIVTHGPGQFAGDIDLLTRRPVIVDGVARGPTEILRVPYEQLRAMLTRVPGFGEKLLVAFTRRRAALSKRGKLGLRVVGPRHCKHTNLAREFLHKNFVPFYWLDAETPDGEAVLAKHPPADGAGPTPVVEFGDGSVVVDPGLRDLATRVGVWKECPTDVVDLAIVGAGPAGLSAAVYAASEGLSTLLLDRLGPGGQAGGSSKIENFIGFPAGLSGTDLATRGVLQLLKFGGRLIAPITVARVEVPADPTEPKLLHVDCGGAVRARVVLVATGVCWRKLPAADAERFEGAGVHYVCTAVEAALYDDQDVAVVGGGNSAGQAAMFLAECCPARRVTILVRGKLDAAMSEYLTTRLRGAPNVTIREGAEVAAVHGGVHVETVEVKVKDGAAERLPCGAVFVFIGADPAGDWLPSEVARDELGYLLTGTEAVRSGRWPLKDRDPCPLETTLPGVMAAGDLRAGSTKRVGFAVGDGSLAVTCAHRLLTLKK